MHNTIHILGVVITIVFSIYVAVIEIKASFNYWTISRVIANEVGRCFLLFGLCLITTAYILKKRGI